MTHPDTLVRARDLIPPSAALEVTADALTVKAADENGFDISFARTQGQWVISVGPWRGYFDDATEALECFGGALSPEAYLVRIHRGPVVVRTDVHWPSGMVSTIRSTFSPFWRRKSVTTRRNLWVPPSSTG